jgi:hypothetical protein
MRGEFVLVRAFGGKPLKRRVWDVGVGVVYITSDEQFQNLISGKRAVTPIGFPAEDVFTDLKSHFPDDSKIDWSKLIPWRAAATFDQMSAVTQEDLIEIEDRPKQYPLSFEVAPRQRFDLSAAIQIPMFPGLADEDVNTRTRNSKRAFNENKRRGRFGCSTTKVPTCGSTTPQGYP